MSVEKGRPTVAEDEQTRTVEQVVLAALRNRYVTLPRNGTVQLAGEITRAVLEHLHRTGALSVPPSDLHRAPGVIAPDGDLTP